VEFIRTLFEQQPLIALFLTIAIGYLVGEINVKGFSLGVGAVLFVALATGWFAPKSAPAPMIGNIGLALFLYTVGIQYGQQFFVGLTSTNGLKANLIAVIGVLLSGGASLLFISTLDLKIGYALGLFAGSGTSTPTLQAAIATLDNDDPAVGYSVAYPFGVAGPILFLYLAFSFLKPRVQLPAGAGMEILEIVLQRAEYFGRRLSEVMGVLPTEVQIVALRRDERNQPAYPNSVIAENDVLLAVAPTKAILEQARKSLGEAAPGRLARDRRDLDYLRVFASRPSVVGLMLADLGLPGDKSSVVIHVRRGDVDLHARPDLVLEFGDRVGLLANRADFPAIRSFFGDSIKGTAEFSYISIGLGMARPDRCSQYSGAPRRLDQLGTVWRVDNSVDSWQPAPEHRPELDHANFRESRVAKPRAHAISGTGRNGLWSQVCCRGHGNWITDAGPGSYRFGGSGPACSVTRLLRFPDAVRRCSGYRRRRLRQCRHLGLLKSAGAER
jgi:putative transport protein